MAFGQWFEDQQQPSNVALSDLCTHLTGRSNTEGRIPPLYDGEEDEIDSESSRWFCGLCHKDDWRKGYHLAFRGPPFSPSELKTPNNCFPENLCAWILLRHKQPLISCCLLFPRPHGVVSMSTKKQEKGKKKSRRGRLKPLPLNG